MTTTIESISGNSSSSASAGVENKYFVYGQGLIYEDDNSNLLIHHYDQVGSTTALTDASGSIKETYEYSPYGEIHSGNTSLTEFLYNGMYGVITDSNGLYYMRARYYNPTILRFINQDVVLGTLTDIQSLNRYAYCEGNPVSFLDPFGLDRLDTTIIHGITGAVNILASIITWGGFPQIGYALTVAASSIDIAFLFYDIYVDLTEQSGFEFFVSDVCSLVLDVMGLVTGGACRIESKWIKYLEEGTSELRSTERGFIEYENELRKVYNDWSFVDKHDGHASLIVAIYSIIKCFA